jgi:hypothetical protein
LSDHLQPRDSIQVLAFNNCDLKDTDEPTVSTKDIPEGQEQLPVELFQVSAKDDIHITELFEFAARDARRRFPPDAAAAKPVAAPGRKGKLCCSN